MKITMAHLPDPTDTPAHNLQDGGIAAIYLDHKYGSFSILFGHQSPEATVAYLTALIDEATALRAKVQEAQA